MKKLFLYLYPLIFLVSCSSLKIKDDISIDENFDWLQRGRTSENINSGAGLIGLNLKQIWSFNADAGFSKNAMISTDGILFASTLRGETYGINILNGKSLGRFGKTGGGVNCPAYYKNNLIITFDGNEDASVLRYNLKTGEVVWKINCGMIKSAPLIENEFIYITSKDSSVYKLNKDDGTVIWKTKKGNDNIPFDQFVTTPVISNDLLFAVTSKGKLICLNKNSGILNWQKNLSQNVLSDLTVSDNKIFINTENGNNMCYNFSGDKIWENKYNTSFTSSFSISGQNLITAGIDGNLYSLNPETGRLNWTFKTNGAIYCNPVIFNDKIFLSSFDKNLYILDLTTGEKLWNMKFESRLRTSPLVWKNYLFVACDNREIYCFEFLK